MKHYYMKQKVFAIRDRYKFYDENENVAYYCEGKMFSFTHEMKFLEAEGKSELYTIKRKVFTFMPKYFLYKPDGGEAAFIQKRFTLLKQHFDISSEGQELKMDGNAWGYDFQVKDQDKMLLEVHKKWIAWGDTYQITIHDEAKTALLLALVVMIDDCLHDNQNKRY